MKESVLNKNIVIVSEVNIINNKSIDCILMDFRRKA